MATRINKYLSEVGYCSRRRADKLIKDYPDSAFQVAMAFRKKANYFKSVIRDSSYFYIEKSLNEVKNINLFQELKYLLWYVALHTPLFLKVWNSLRSINLGA